MKRSLRERREQLGLSQNDLAQRHGLSASDVSLVERGKATPPRLHRVRRALIREELRQRVLWNQERRQAQAERAWAEAPNCRALDILRRAALSAAWELLEQGDYEAADRLLEVLPDRDRMTLLSDYFGEDIIAPPRQAGQG